jgi:alpha 1,2-mannosyltransferase
MTIKSNHRWILLEALALITLSALTIYQVQHLYTPRLAIALPRPNTHSISNITVSLEPQKILWKQLQVLLDENAPNCDPPNLLHKAKTMRHSATREDMRPSLISITDEAIENMQNAHRNFLQNISVWRLQKVTTSRTRGIVTTAGGEYLPMFLVSLRMLRRTGSTLPVEVFIGSHLEYDAHICEKLLPVLNARCIVLTDVMDTTWSVTKIEKYKFKAFAMLFSTFEELLFLDADCFAVQDVAQLFSSLPFKQTGMITWPDFWQSTTSPIYYNISSQPIPSTADRASSESGQLMINKGTHLLPLLLAVYYNYWGPDYYYPLLSQGAWGQGDKETFLAAASATNHSFFAVSERVRKIGRIGTDGVLKEAAMVQFSPLEDWILTSEGLWRVQDTRDADLPSPFFVHAHRPKFNPVSIWDKKSFRLNFLRSDGSPRRGWVESAEVMGAFGWDLERAVWKEMRWVGCELEGKLESWKGREGVCKRLEKHFEAVFGE